MKRERFAFSKQKPSFAKYPTMQDQDKAFDHKLLVPDLWQQEALPVADRLYLTLIDAEYEGDVFFPAWEADFPRELSRREISLNKVNVVFLVLER